ncbi:sulfate ABC transporter permease subunit CysW [Synechococcus elongatus]|uniref:Sulfate ABC transporter permease subunit CysW n=2 Tax=Synechococcus elongatus TaxID=32046 RepID=A0AAN1QPX9_SYNEL|nr:sulfate ABC transporter permease subunit CysW [Synechococcus elongatus]AZB73245.1 sulfate ABC transporter permease subunit CysW [Synechococcus elongatus PCC 11801]QFZ92397.1 sulfate ABC transporter permease subunit CysW [Synechococcus elongatus PCC 11802]
MVAFVKARRQIAGAKESKSLLPLVLIGLSLFYVGLIIIIPAANVAVQAFSEGLSGFIKNLGDRNLQEAIRLTLLMGVISVPLNTLFGLAAAFAIARKQFPGKSLLLSVIDLPFSISPVVAGLMIVLLYGRNGWLGPFLESNNIKIIFAWPGMALATIFVSMPFVAREVIPNLEEIGTDAEEAASTLGANGWQTFWRVTLPSIKWSMLYGVVLTTARALGEFGAVSVVSGSITGKTQTLPLFVEEAYKQYQTTLSYTAALLLGGISLVTLVLKAILEARTGRQGRLH